MLATEMMADVLRAVSGTDMAPLTSAVIVAAGSSTRMGKKGAKQFLEVGGVPVLARTLIAFQNAPYVAEIVVVAKENDFARIKQMAKEYAITKLKRLVQGGDTRAASVKNGFQAIDPNAKFVAIHDGARCLITPEMIRRVLRAAYRYKAASAAASVCDTVKLADKRHTIAKTLDRDLVYLAQTPQVFHTDLYRAALNTCSPEGCTDDNQLMEQLGVAVKLVDCGKENIKITHPDDIRFAELLLAAREAQP